MPVHIATDLSEAQVKAYRIADNPDDQADADALLGLVDELIAHLGGQGLDDVPEAAWLSITHEPIFAADHLDAKHVLTSVLTATYRVQR